MFFAPATFRRSFHTGYQPSNFNGRHADAFQAFFADTFESGRENVKVDSDDTSITLNLDVPGLSKEQLTISIEGRIVRIHAKDDAPRSFKAAYKVASDIDPAKSEAKLEHGVLTLKLAKVAPENRETVLSIS